MGGRWPANVILQHLSTCQRAGTKRVKGSHSTTGVWGNAAPNAHIYGKWDRDDKRQGYVDAGGKEEVDAWNCAPGCPVADIDEQSGVLTSGTKQPHHKRNVPRMGHGNLYRDGEKPRDTLDYFFAGDTGGASRFFKQVQNQSDEGVPDVANPPLTTIHLCRKPLEGTVAANALKHGTGSLNIDPCRIGAESISTHDYPGYDNHSALKGKDTTVKGEPIYREHAGRWPANVILEHLPGCEKVGTKKVKAKQSTAGRRTIKWGVGEGGSTYEKGTGAQFPTPDGMTAEDAWACAPDCPVADIDEQSGVTSNHRPNRNTGSQTQSGSVFKQRIPTLSATPNDQGGASRYFKQTNHDIAEYLRTMISTPDEQAWIGGPGFKKWLTMDREPVCGIVYQGVLNEDEVALLFAKLRPGGHIFLIAPDEQPTGHTGAILLEDGGFEIRDAILWVRGAGRTHYVAKSGRSEREAGCAHLEGKDTTGTVDRKVGSAGTQNPRAGAGRGAGAPRHKCKQCGLHLGGGRASSVCPKTGDGAHEPYEYSRGAEVRNFHPTVKPIKVMKRLLLDVPKDQGPVLDPFMGSGTTGIACTMTGHDFIGIERDPEYLPIADARIRHWDREHVGWQGATIESDLKVEKVVKPPLDIFNLFG